jgi:hypothetical protein
MLIFLYVELDKMKINNKQFSSFPRFIQTIIITLLSSRRRAIDVLSCIPLEILLIIIDFVFHDPLITFVKQDDNLATWRKRKAELIDEVDDIINKRSRPLKARRSLLFVGKDVPVQNLFQNIPTSTSVEDTSKNLMVVDLKQLFAEQIDLSTMHSLIDREMFCHHEKFRFATVKQFGGHVVFVWEKREDVDRLPEQLRRKLMIYHTSELPFTSKDGELAEVYSKWRNETFVDEDAKLFWSRPIEFAE